MEEQNTQLAVLAYGSLLVHPGNWLGKHMGKLIRCETPFGVEYAGRSMKGRGGAPTLVRSNTGSAVRGALIVLDLEDRPDALLEVRNELAKREGVKSGTSSSIRDDIRLQGYRLVYSDFPAHTNPQDLKASNLAQFAIASVAECVRAGQPFKNGIRYLMDNIEWGATTNLTAKYEQAILDLSSSRSLEEAEAKLLRRAITVHSSGAWRYVKRLFGKVMNFMLELSFNEQIKRSTYACGTCRVVSIRYRRALHFHDRGRRLPCWSDVEHEWWAHHGPMEDISRLMKSLYQRRSSIRDLIVTFRNSTRNPFPNWAGS